MFLCHDAGGDVVLLYASKYHEIKTVVNLSGRYDLKAGIEERLGKDYLERIRKDGFFDVKRSSGKSFTQANNITSTKFELDIDRELSCSITAK